MRPLSHLLCLAPLAMLALVSCQVKSDGVKSSVSPELISTGEAQLKSTVFHSRLTAMSVKGEQLVLGHESGGMSMWRALLSAESKPLHSWFAHEGSVRHVSIDLKGELSSLSADGSLAKWTPEGTILKRLRVSEGHPNCSLELSDEVVVYGNDRGVLTAMNGGKRQWRTAGEHGRAVFGVARLDQERLLSVGSDGWARCWLIKNGDRCGSLPIHDGWATVIKEMKGGWVTAGSDGWIKWWPLEWRTTLTRSTIQSQNDQLSSPAVSFLAHKRDITSLDVSGSLVVSGSEEGRVTLLELSSKDGEQVSFKRLWSYQAEELKPVMTVAIDRERAKVLVGGGKRATLTLLSLEQGESLLRKVLR